MLFNFFSQNKEIEFQSDLRKIWTNEYFVHILCIFCVCLLRKKMLRSSIILIYLIIISKNAYPD